MQNPGTRSDRHVIAFLAALATLMAFGIDPILPALDEIRSTFDLAPGDNSVTRIVSVYIFGLSLGQVVYGPLADRFGRSPVLLAGLGIYAAGAFASMLAPSLTTLLVARALWGFGAASAGLLRFTIARDLYRGDQMARVISIVMGFFLLGPIVAPMFGEAILAVASWRWVFGSALVTCAGLAVWAVRFGETLDPANRRPLRVGPTLAAFRLVLTTRIAVAYLLATTFVYGAFFTYLASSQPIFDIVYDRADLFALLYGASSGLMAAAFFTVNRFISRYGAHHVAVVSLVCGVTLSATLLLLSVAADGQPSFWVWVIGIAVVNSFMTILVPTGTSLALDPMGEMAGSASGIIGFVSTAGGSVLSFLLNSRITDSVTPMMVGYVMFGSVALVCALASGAGALPQVAGPSTRSR
ncbi:MAG: multidrug effflux MFS transporter [Acidimicrobiales bacterium]|jgi:DHA1 family bicyclomycin/chloramphenicol resistance-like MFS transporter|nr:multidrug effflux MFS transporter [Actinomycetes bacterium]MDP6105192.1 multidrug effflux MFS transporter [Acidimicrobiales bacterium]MCP4843699.1 multidrug effflux MFS transporter [Actinomycetes bacterium]MDP7125280.1 multidrug effflux MFS transporter [Acidimicrobiales bacterium]MDP7352604.1 multidrug effflux MFS transporter [Acidimicrobiales bacterium]|tara:strand:+ start:261 stop:1493 length:1233 start_codon:yes stop_codon:yes gene_type:complete